MSKAVTIRLTWPEVNCACQVALFRQVHNTMRGLKQRHGASDDFCDGIVMHTRGCLGEIAVSKFLNRYWSGVIGMREIDIGFAVDARSYPERGTRRLVLHKSDTDELPFVAVKVGEDPTVVKLCGWIIAKDGKIDENWKDPQNTNRHAYFVPDDSLRKMDELKALLPSEG